jgi:hypothetical protein
MYQHAGTLRPLVHAVPPHGLYRACVPQDHRSALRELVETALGEDVCAWVRRRHQEDASLGRRPLTEELNALLKDRKVNREINPLTLNRWCPDEFHG